MAKKISGSGGGSVVTLQNISVLSLKPDTKTLAEHGASNCNRG